MWVWFCFVILKFLFEKNWEIWEIFHSKFPCLCDEFRHFTREALPRLDNYRDILSIQAVYRPTLDDLHNATMSNKVCMQIAINFLKFTQKMNKMSHVRLLVIGVLYNLRLCHIKLCIFDVDIVEWFILHTLTKWEIRDRNFKEADEKLVHYKT